MKLIWLFAIVLLCPLIDGIKKQKGVPIHICFKVCLCELFFNHITCSKKKLTEVKLDYFEDEIENGTILDLSYNNIVELPSQEYLLKHLPNLRVVNINKNLEFDCDRWNRSAYDKIVIHHLCAFDIARKASGWFSSAKDWVIGAYDTVVNGKLYDPEG